MAKYYKVLRNGAGTHMLVYDTAADGYPGEVRDSEGEVTEVEGTFWGRDYFMSFTDAKKSLLEHVRRNRDKYDAIVRDTRRLRSSQVPTEIEHIAEQAADRLAEIRAISEGGQV